MHSGRIVLIVEIEGVRGGAVGERGGRRRVALLARKARGGARLFPTRKASVQFGNARREARAADDAERVEHQRFDGLHHRRR
jgi:hypothetical protein